MSVPTPSVFDRRRLSDKETAFLLQSVRAMQELCHHQNLHWHFDIQTGAPVERNVGEMIALAHSELSEALEGHRSNRMDDKLPDRKQIEVELADLIVRVMDLAGSLKLDVGGALVEKMLFNETRPDHSREARLAATGKKY